MRAAWYCNDNEKSKRIVDAPTRVRYVRLMITRPMQYAGGKVLCINEIIRANSSATTTVVRII